MSNSQAKVHATIPESVRLERVRAEAGYGDSLWNFWKKLCSEPAAEAGPIPSPPPAKWGGWIAEDGTYRVSYEAVRNYHYDRHAPGHYYAQVATVFGVRLEWLLTGHGGMTHEEDSLLRAKLQVEDGFFFLSTWSDAQKRRARLHQLLDHLSPRTVGVEWPMPLSFEAMDAVKSYLTNWLDRVGDVTVLTALTGGDDRDATEADVARFFDRTFAQPLEPFRSAPYGQQLAAFYSHMAMMHLREISESSRERGPAE